MHRRAALCLVLLIALPGCRPRGRSVRAWIESRDAKGHIVAGASVAVDGQPLGTTDQRGLFRLKLRRNVGQSVTLFVQDDRYGDGSAWTGTFTVGTNGEPVEHSGGRIVVVLGGAP